MLGVRVCPLHGPGAGAAGGRAAEPAAAAGGRLSQPRRQEPRRGGGQSRTKPPDSRPLRGQLFLFSRTQGMVNHFWFFRSAHWHSVQLRVLNYLLQTSQKLHLCLNSK